MIKKYAICFGAHWNVLNPNPDEKSPQTIIVGHPLYDSVEQAEAYVPAFLKKTGNKWATVIPIYFEK